MGEGASERETRPQVPAGQSTGTGVEDASRGEVRDADRAGMALADAASSSATVYALASGAHGVDAVETAPDFVVVLEVVENRLAEAVRLSRVLGRLRIPGGVLVVGRAHFDAWSGVSGTAMYEAANEGRVVAES